MAFLEGWAALPAQQSTEDGFLATPLVKDLQEEKVLRQTWFGARGWVTLCFQREHAVYEALASISRGVPEAASMVTAWLVVHVWIPADAVVELFREGKIEKRITYGLHSWRYYGDLDLPSCDYTLDHLTIQPLGVEEWARIAVTPTCGQEAVQEEGTCKSCAAQGQRIWGSYCATCWNEHWEHWASPAFEIL